uniref:Uncharacterized protein n=1 Tax=Rhizophora mucronata TaxID=61149 RepID=A0A2P2P556_RHIMU
MFSINASPFLFQILVIIIWSGSSMSGAKLTV